MNSYLGIDTSNYTTSLSLCDESGNILANLKKLLPVEQGSRGLRQSDAVFSHIRNLDHLFPSLERYISEHGLQVAAVGSSAFPRDAEGSYMPCFLVGKSHASFLSSVLRIPCYQFSHQAGHVSAAVYSSGASVGDDPFYAFHVSGGTTEILLVERLASGRPSIVLLGGSQDLHAGQVIDRIGVNLGFPFPAGPFVERAALDWTGPIPRHKVSVDGLRCHLSGLENLANAMISQGKDPSEISAFTLRFIGETLVRLTDNLLSAHGEHPIVYAGGVMSCSILKEMLKGSSRYFADPAFSSDNAAGIALLTRQSYLKEQQND